MNTMTPEEIVAKFANSIEHFEPIDGQPSDTDFTGIREVLDTLLIQILYKKTGSVHNPISLIFRMQNSNRSMARNSSNPRGQGHTMQESTTMPRPSSVRARKLRTKQSARIALPKRRCGKRRRSLSSLSSNTLG